MIASAAVDDSSTIIVRSTVVDQNFSIDLSATNSNGSGAHLLSITKQTDNNSDDSTASNPTISATSSITDLSNTSALVINTSILEGDTENVYSITDYSWYSVDANNNRTLLQSGTTNNLELTVNSAQNILLSTTYLDGELNQKTVESNTLSVDQVNIDNSIASLRFTIGSYHGGSWTGTVYLSANINGSVFTTTVDNRSLESSSEESQRITNITNQFISVLNSSDSGLIASAAVDDSSTIIVRSTVVDQNLSIDLSATNSNGSGAHLFIYYKTNR